MKEKIFAGYNNVFAERLRSLMDERKTTQLILANEIGVTRQAISQYMDGSAQPNIDKLYKIAIYFDVSTDYLLGKTDIKINDIDDMMIGNKIGLNENSINELKSIKNNKGQLFVLNEILNDKNILKLITNYFITEEIYQYYKNSRFKSLPLKFERIAYRQIAFSSLIEYLPLFRETICKTLKSNTDLIDELIKHFLIYNADLDKIKATDPYYCFENEEAVNEILKQSEELPCDDYYDIANEEYEHEIEEYNLAVHEFIEYYESKKRDLNGNNTKEG